MVHVQQILATFRQKLVYKRLLSVTTYYTHHTFFPGAGFVYQLGVGVVP